MKSATDTFSFVLRKLTNYLLIRHAHLLFTISNVKPFAFSISGEVGDWRNHFTPEQLKMFDEDYERQMKDVNIPFKTDLI